MTKKFFNYRYGIITSHKLYTVTAIWFLGFTLRIQIAVMYNLYLSMKRLMIDLPVYQVAYSYKMANKLLTKFGSVKKIIAVIKHLILLLNIACAIVIIV